ncbi:MAG: sugar transferase [Thalassovita sp.]
MTWSKRAFDLCLSVLLMLVLFPVVLCLALVLLIRQGRPIFYVSERMQTNEVGFNLIKFRTMTDVATDSGVSGGDKSARITPMGAFLRRYRLDETPQLWNIFKGDISFVGPRPPLRRYVEQFPDLYREVLRNRPGVTGLATVVFHRHEEALLAPCKNSAETEAVYVTRCVPRKAKLDLIYQDKRSFCLDLVLMLKTVVRRTPIPRSRR